MQNTPSNTSKTNMDRKTFLLHVSFHGCTYHLSIDIFLEPGYIQSSKQLSSILHAPWKCKIAPENRPSQKEGSVPTIIFQGLRHSNSNLPSTGHLIHRRSQWLGEPSLHLCTSYFTGSSTKCFVFFFWGGVVTINPFWRLNSLFVDDLFSVM